MPRFSNQPSSNTAVWEPQAADTRLAQTAGASEAGVFTSDLSVSEYVLLGEAGFEPLGFVVGSSIYHVVIEFVATGTAVRALAATGVHKAPDGRAFTSDLSAQDFFRLLAAGAVPVAFVLGTCVYHVAHQGVLQTLRQAGQNQEMMRFTQGVYEARELALGRMQAEAAQVGSSGIVGVTVDVKNHVWGEHATEFLATGTAIRRLADEHKLPETSPRPTFTLGLDQ